MQPRRAQWTMPLVHSSHSCTICRQPKSPWRASLPPARTQTPAYCCAPSGHGCRGASTAGARCVSHSANQHAAKSRPRRTSRFPRRRKRREGWPLAGQSQRREGTPEPPGGGAGGCTGPLQLQAGKGGSGGAGGQPGKLGLRNQEGWSVSTSREDRGAHWTERGGQDWQERGTLGAKARPRRQKRCGRKGRGSVHKIWRRTDGLQSRERRAPLGVGGAGRRARRAGRGSLRADVQEGSAWRSSSGLGALDPKTPARVGVASGE